MSLGDNIEKAIHDWLNKMEEDICDESGRKYRLVYSGSINISLMIFYKYIHINTEKTTLEDGSHGKEKISLDEYVKFAGTVLACADNSNEGCHTKRQLI